MKRSLNWSHDSRVTTQMKDQDSGLGCLRMSLSFLLGTKLSSLILPGELPPYIETVCH
ncbi:hypothetical protein N657DRAFT_649867, partial [Parathielavia appendiculata]